MKKRILSLLLVCIVMSSFASCSEDIKGFELGHFDGSDTSAGYDTELLYKNTSEFLGGDSGVIYVSKEQDPIYGGYFYQYMSECGHVHNNGVPSNGNGNTATDKNDADYHSHVAISRSKDLYDWELCGVVDNGLGLKLGMDAFMDRGIWAPETVYCPCTCEGECELPNQHKKYFMYFGGKGSTSYVDRMREKYGHGPEAGVFSTFWTAGIAVSDTPVGPFKIVTSENVYDGQPNLNGEYLREDWPTLDFARWYGFEENGFLRYNTDYSPFFDVNGDFYLVFNSTGVTHKGEDDESGAGICGWGIKMKDMVSPDWSTITWLMSPGSTKNNLEGDDGERDPNKPWRDGIIVAPVRVEYKGDPNNNQAFRPYDASGLVQDEMYQYDVNPDFVNDPNYPRSEISSYYQWEEWQDGTPNTQTITVNGSTRPNPAYNVHSGIGSSTIREGVQVINYPDKNGKQVYYLSFTYTGVQSALYNVHFATASTPLGNIKGEEYTLPKGKEFSMSLGVDLNNDYMSNLGHHDYIEVDDEWWIVHWEWSVPFGTVGSYDIGRIYALSPMAWLNDPTVDYYLPLANGPTKHLQAKPSIATGYRNIASDAKVTATNVVDDSVQYLTDGYTVTKSMYADWVFKANNETKITLKFDEPRDIRGVFVYNSYEFENGFSKIALIEFELAEKPLFYTGDGDGTHCYIKDLGFPDTAYKAIERIMYSGNASLATFDEIKVNSITITVKDHLGRDDILNIAEIMVLGK